jgi:hypothetical protein
MLEMDIDSYMSGRVGPIMRVIVETSEVREEIWRPTKAPAGPPTATNKEIEYH